MTGPHTAVRPPRTAPAAPPVSLADAVRRGREGLLARQRDDGHWVGELEGDTILESEYILLMAFLGRERDPRVRLAANYLQGGTFKFDDVSGLATVLPEPSIPNGFSRSNLAQTVAMFPDTSTTATSKFIINLVDNVQFNTQNGGFTVFGGTPEVGVTIDNLLAREGTL